MPGHMIATVEGRPIPDAPDLPRMRRERMARLREQLSAQGLDGLVLLWPSAVLHWTKRVRSGPPKLSTMARAPRSATAPS